MDSTIIITIIITLLGVIGYFINRYFISIDSAVKQFQASVSKLDLAVTEMNLMLKTMNTGCSLKHSKIDTEITEHGQQIQELIVLTKQTSFKVDEILKHR